MILSIYLIVDVQGTVIERLPPHLLAFPLIHSHWSPIVLAQLSLPVESSPPSCVLSAFRVTAFWH